MSKMKSYMMENQEYYRDLLIAAVGSCNTFEEFVIIADDIANMYVIDLPNDMLEEIVDEVFENFWESYNV